MTRKGRDAANGGPPLPAAMDRRTGPWSEASQLLRGHSSQITVFPRKNAKPVMLDLVNPVGAAWRLFGLARQTGLKRSGGALEAAL